jgi:hypothetical protein
LADKPLGVDLPSEAILDEETNPDAAELPRPNRETNDKGFTT